MRAADYIFQFLADRGTEHVFLVTGGGAMFLDDAAGRQKNLKYICNLHEQACAMAAEGYARISGKPGVICVTTGPGGTNAITGVAGAWLDSVPMIIISGQIKRQTCIASYPQIKLRQLGDQELNIVDVVKPVTKYAKMVTDVESLRYELEKAWYLALNGRPGPVWLDIPLDIQAAPMPDKELTGFVPEKEMEIPETDEAVLRKVIEQFKCSKRPAIICGIGVRHAKAVEKLKQFAEKHDIPILTSISGIDLVESDHPLFAGRPGILGERAANFIMQNCDLLLTVGTRMGIRIIGYAWEKVAREACKIMVDVDEAELQKPTFKPDIAIQADAGEFLDKMLSALDEDVKSSAEWLDYCRRLRAKYPVVTQKHRDVKDYVSSYVLPELVSRNCPDNAVVVTGNGTAYTSTFQAIPVRKNMRMFSNEACASMGYGLPAAIGAALADASRQVICFTGDGSIQMNIQELQTVKNYQLPIKIFVYNNDGYLSIKNTQKAFFDGNFVGSEHGSGVILPDMEKISAAYGLPFRRISDNSEAMQMMPLIFADKKAEIIEVMTDPFEELGPKAASKRLPDGTMVSAPLEDLAPFLPREEFLDNMIIKPIAEEF